MSTEEFKNMVMGEVTLLVEFMEGKPSGLCVQSMLMLLSTMYITEGLSEDDMVRDVRGMYDYCDVNRRE